MGDLRQTGTKFEVEYPETFKFDKEGDYIEGEVATIGFVPTRDKEALRMIITDSLGFNWTVWANGILGRKLQEAKVFAGDRIGVEFVSWHKSTTSAFKYKDYELYLSK